MAIYHCTVKSIQRSKGQSAVACASYRSGQSLYDEQTGKMKTCRPIHDDVEYTTLIGWTKTREELWNAVERAEKRKDAQLAKEIEVALPAELDYIHRVMLAEDFGAAIRKQYNVAIDIAIHSPKRDSNNYHAHIMITLRQVEDDKLSAKKLRNLDGKEAVENLRRLWQDTANHYLKEHNTRIDCRSYAEQNIPLIPTEHEGHAQPRTYYTKQRNQRIRATNAELMKSLKLVQDSIKSIIRRINEITVKQRYYIKKYKAGILTLIEGRHYLKLAEEKAVYISPTPNEKKWYHIITEFVHRLLKPVKPEVKPEVKPRYFRPGDETPSPKEEIKPETKPRYFRPGDDTPLPEIKPKTKPRYFRPGDDTPLPEIKPKKQEDYYEDEGGIKI